MFSLSSAVVTLALTSSATTSPTQTLGFTGGQPATITWIDNADQPPLASFGLAKVSIYAGNSKDQTSLQTISESVDVTTMSLGFTPDASIGPNGSQYFIRFESLTNKDPNDPSIPLLAFSHVFTLSGMTGVFNAQVQSQIDGQSTAPIGGTPTSSPSTAPSTTAANAAKVSSTDGSKSSAAASSSASKSAKAPAASGAAVPALVGGFNLWVGIATGVLGAVAGAAIL
ncbi:hypothetical protein B0H14DRAFT_2668147 [Mycena olivaceomarginata]|nr:hypothetical protein B0H14DRAFT_2668147 [Mycena olivaceomarginata]